MAAFWRASLVNTQRKLWRFRQSPLSQTSPWIGVENGGAGRGLGDRVRDRLRAQLDTSFQMLRHARDRGILVMSGSDTGNASALSHGRWHGKEAELLVKEVGMPPMEAYEFAGLGTVIFSQSASC